MAIAPQCMCCTGSLHQQRQMQKLRLCMRRRLLHLLPMRPRHAERGQEIVRSDDATQVAMVMMCN